MRQPPVSIPRPLVRLNQWVIVSSVLLVWLTQQEWILLLPLIAGLLGLLFRFNPVMQFGKLFLRKPPSQYIPEEWQQQQFNQVIAVVFLFLGLLAYWLNMNLAGYIFTGMVFLAAFLAILGFCIGCFIRFQWQQYRYRRAAKH